MTAPAIRPDVVALLADLVLGPDVASWCHDDGRPATAEERVVVFDATFAELQAAKGYNQLAAENALDEVAAFDRIIEISAPYREQMGEDALMSDIVGAIPEPERTEFLDLMEKVGYRRS